MFLEQLIELPPAAYAPGGTNGAESVVHPSPAIDQELGLSHRNEQVAAEELVSELAYE